MMSIIVCCKIFPGDIFGVITEEAECQAVVLIPKGGGNYRGIGLVELIWKAVAALQSTTTAPSTGSGQVAVRGSPLSWSSCYSWLRP